MRFHSSCVLPVMVLLASCAGPDRARSDKESQPPAPPQSYVRITNTDSNRIQLQIAAREFVPKRRREPSIWLVGVSHIGDTNYYAALQTHLDAQSLVLFEGVGAAEAENDSASAKSNAQTSSLEPTPTRAAENRGSLQSAMAASLGLVFQLEAIDYRRDNFVNSDLSIAQLRQLMSQTEAGSGKTGASEGFENLIQLMQGDSWFDSLLQVGLRFLGASPKFRALGRLALIDLIGQLQGDPSRLQGLPPEMKQLLDVLLQKRNEKVVADLKEQLPEIERGGSVAVFFGTGHMPDLEMRLRQELGYRPVKDLWFTAFQVDLASAGVTPEERGFIDNFVKWQLAEAGANKHSETQGGQSK